MAQKRAITWDLLIHPYYMLSYTFGEAKQHIIIRNARFMTTVWMKYIDRIAADPNRALFIVPIGSYRSETSEIYHTLFNRLWKHAQKKLGPRALRGSYSTLNYPANLERILKLGPINSTGRGIAFGEWQNICVKMEADRFTKESGQKFSRPRSLCVPESLDRKMIDLRETRRKSVSRLRRMQIKIRSKNQPLR